LALVAQMFFCMWSGMIATLSKLLTADVLPLITDSATTNVADGLNVTPLN